MLVKITFLFNAFLCLEPAVQRFEEYFIWSLLEDLEDATTA